MDVTKLHITLVKSPIGYSPEQRKTVEALGLRKLHQTVEHDDSPAIRGMVSKVIHLLKVVEV